MATDRERLHFVQWIRVLLTVLVVAHHAAEPYVAVGGDWSDIVNDPARSDILLTLFVLNRTFFMGFFFLIAGYFVDASLARHGAWAVVRDRLVRLGIPLLVIVVFVFGSMGFAIFGEGTSYFRFIFFNYLGGGNAEFGHLWFIAHLLVYVLVYVGLRALVPALGTLGARSDPPGNVAILVFVVSIGAILALVRQWWPIDSWTRFFGLVPGEPAHMPFYIALFSVGLLAGRANWLTRFDTRLAVTWGSIGAVVFLVLAVWSTPRLAQPDTPTMKLIWAFLEPVVGVGAILGITALFRRYLAAPSRLLAALEGNLYGVYLLHLFIVIGLQVALVQSAMPALAKFAIVVVATLFVSFPIIAVLRRLPGFRAVL